MHQILNEKQSKYFHTTTLSNAISIIQSKTFKLHSVDKAHNELSKTKNKDSYEHHQYSMSLARSIKSDFNAFMLSMGSAIFVLNGNQLAANNKTTPYAVTNPDGSVDRGEFEERLTSDKPTMPIRGAVNNTISSVHLIDYTVDKGSPDYKLPKGAWIDDGVPELGKKLISICQQQNITVFVYTNMKDFSLLRNGRAL